jgi:hypothetical protein
LTLDFAFRESVLAAERISLIAQKENQLSPPRGSWYDSLKKKERIDFGFGRSDSNPEKYIFNSEKTDSGFDFLIY